MQRIAACSWPRLQVLEANGHIALLSARLHSAGVSLAARDARESEPHRSPGLLPVAPSVWRMTRVVL